MSDLPAITATGTTATGTTATGTTATGTTAPVNTAQEQQHRPDIGRVYIVTPGGTRALGGIGRLVQNIVRAWQHPESPPIIVDSYGPGRKIWMPFYFAFAFMHLLVAASLGRIDLLHVHMSERLSVLRKGLVVHLAKAFRIPVVLHLHGADFADYYHALPAQRQARLRRMVAKADAVITLGRFWSDFVHSELGIDRQRIVMLHNAVPGPVDVLQRTGKKPCQLLFLGVVGERKGVLVLLQALADTRFGGDEWRLVIAGNGEIERFRAQAKILGLADRIHFTGWVSEVDTHKLLREADVLVLPSRNEGLPMAILEAMAYGLPIVSTPVGSIPDAVADGENGYLVPVGDVTALATAIQSLCRDSQLRLHMGHLSRRRYTQYFEIQAYMATLLALFRRLRLRQLPVPTVSPSVSGKEEV